MGRKGMLHLYSSGRMQVRSRFQKGVAESERRDLRFTDFILTKTTWTRWIFVVGRVSIFSLK